MTTSPEKVWFDEDSLWVLLSDGRTIGAPLAWFPRLWQADRYSREQFEFTAHGIHWSALDEDISVQGLLNGQHKHDPELRALSDHAAGNVEEWKDPTEDGVWHE